MVGPLAQLRDDQDQAAGQADYDPTARPGDITGRQFLAQADAKEKRAADLNTTRKALVSGEALELITVPGGGAHSCSPRKSACT